MSESVTVGKMSVLARCRIGYRWFICIPVLAFVLMGLLFLPLLGFEYDEVMFAPLIFHPERSLFAAHLFHHVVPLMQMSYIGRSESLAVLAVAETGASGGLCGPVANAAARGYHDPDPC
jgi:hypothetical protein